MDTGMSMGVGMGSSADKCAAGKARTPLTRRTLSALGPGLCLSGCAHHVCTAMDHCVVSV